MFATLQIVNIVNEILSFKILILCFIIMDDIVYPYLLTYSVSNSFP